MGWWVDVVKDSGTQSSSIFETYQCTFPSHCRTVKRFANTYIYIYIYVIFSKLMLRIQMLKYAQLGIHRFSMDLLCLFQASAMKESSDNGGGPIKEKRMQRRAAQSTTLTMGNTTDIGMTEQCQQTRLRANERGTQQMICV